MKIQHMRLVLPPRMRNTAQVDARTIAEAAARTLQAKGAIKGPVSVQVQGHGRPARFIARDVAREVGNQTSRRGG
jgi:hypothetical protein